MLKKRRRKRKKKKKKVTKLNYKGSIGKKLITNTKKQKLKIQSRVWNLKNTMLKKKGRRKRKREKKTNKNKVVKIIKKIQVQN